MESPFFKFYILFALVVFQWSCTSVKKEVKTAIEKKPNIIFIMSDDHATNAISAYGSRLASVSQTPNIDRLAKEGAILNNCFTSNSICTPSRASILTGEYSHNNGVKTLNDDLDPNKKHLAHYFQEAGYHTAVIGKWHLHTEPQGFDHWQVLPRQGLYFNPEFKLKGLDEKRHYNQREKKKYEGYVTDVITDLSLDWMKNRNDDKPFMLMMHHKAPHALWEYHPKYEHLFDGQIIPEPESLFEDKSHRAQETVKKENTLVRLGQRMSGQIKISSVHDYKEWPTGKLDVEGLSKEDIIKATYQKYLKDYLRVIASVDESIGRVLEYLDKNGLAENTIVIYTSDQGMFLGEHQYLDKRWIFEESLRMPFLVRWPGKITPNNKVDELVSNVDFAPTLLDAINQKIPENMQGSSFLPILKDEKVEHWQASIYYRYWMHRDMTPAHFGIRTNDYKLIFYYGMNLDTNSYNHANSQPTWELYDLKKDPLEMNNVYGDKTYASVISDLKKQMLKKREAIGDVDSKFPEVTEELIKDY
ncbi:sulfatase [Flavivirga spongiicola]|uniref:Sulfatase n=1 Tax=Flavivirga spongiicola TaxID=421621 RepID=A0ABU7XWT8_9FLAO|nr:sulfatase [Flavivirga sp. MEBiC05379]MDO5980042.1 sulfatase [Flavivirga sp. MEBiC05379]